MFYNTPYYNANYPNLYNNLPMNTAQQMNSSMPQPPSAQAVATTPNTPQDVKRCNCQWIYVNGIAGVREHIVQPNQTLYFRDNNDPIFYVKSADNFGTAQIKIFRFSEITEQKQDQVIPDETKAEIAEIKSRLDRLEGALHESSDQQ